MPARIARVFLFCFVLVLFAGSAGASLFGDSCTFLYDDFSGLSPNSWSYGEYGSWYTMNEQLGVYQIPGGTWAIAEVDFLPWDLFSVDVDFDLLALPGPNDAIALYPFTSGSTFTLDGHSIDGAAVVVYPADGVMEFMVWNMSASEWNTTDLYPIPSPLLSFGLSFTAGGVVFRANGQDTSLVLSGDFSLAGLFIDSLWIMAKGTGTDVVFDNLCSGPLGSLDVEPPPTVTAPSAPANFRYTLDGSLLSLAWDPASGATGYELAIGVAPGSYLSPASDLGNLTQLGPFDIASVPAGTYYLAVKSHGAGGESAYSNELAITWESPGLPAPGNVGYTLNGNLFTLFWDPVPGAWGYGVYIAVTPGGYGLPLDLGDVTQLGPLDVSGVPAGTYYLAVDAFDVSSVSPISSEVAVTIGSSGSDFILGQSTTQPVSGGPGTSVWDPVSGLEIVFPEGASGQLTVTGIESGPGIGDAGGEGLVVSYSGNEPVQIAIDRRDGVEPELWIHGTPDTLTDGELMDAPVWLPVVPDNPAGSPALFRLYEPGQQRSRAGEGVKAGRAAGDRTYRVLWKSTVKADDWAWKKNAVLWDITKSSIADLYGMLPASVQDRVRSDYEGRLKPVGAYSGWSSAYAPSTLKSRLLGQMEPHFWYNVYGDDGHQADYHVASHESGHYISHLILGDAKFLELAAQGSRIHDIGVIQGARYMREEYAFIADYLLNGNLLYGSYNITESNSVFKQKRNEKDGTPEADVTPAAYDWPRLEGFGAAFLASLNTSRTRIFSHYGDGQLDDIPTFGLSSTELYNILSQGPMTVNGLYNLALAQVGSGSADRLAIMAEMIGWSYNGSGTVVDSNGDGVPGAVVENRSYAGDWDDYTTPQHRSLLTGGDGTFYLRRILPGSSYLRVWYNYEDGEYKDFKDFDISIDKTEPTNAARGLGVLTIPVEQPQDPGDPGGPPPGETPACYWNRISVTPYISSAASFDGVNQITTTYNAGGNDPDCVFTTTHVWTAPPSTLTPGDVLTFDVSAGWWLNGKPSCTTLAAGVSTTVTIGTTVIRAADSQVIVSAEPSGSVGNSGSWTVYTIATPGTTMTISGAGQTGTGGGQVIYKYQYVCP